MNAKRYSLIQYSLNERKRYCNIIHLKLNLHNNKIKYNTEAITTCHGSTGYLHRLYSHDIQRYVNNCLS